MKKNNIQAKPSNYVSAVRVWLNSVYSFNKNLIKNIPSADNLVSKLICFYFTIKSKQNNKYRKPKSPLIKKRQNLSINNIFSSKPEIKHSSNAVHVTIYIYNKKIKTLNYIANYLRADLENLLWKAGLHVGIINKKTAFSSIKFTKRVLKNKTVNKAVGLNHKVIFNKKRRNNYLLLKKFIIACKEQTRENKNESLKHENCSVIAVNDLNGFSKNRVKDKRIKCIKKIINLGPKRLKTQTPSLVKSKNTSFKFFKTIFAFDFLEYMKLRTKVLKKKNLRNKVQSVNTNKSKNVRFVETFFKRYSILLIPRRKDKKTSILPYIDFFKIDINLNRYVELENYIFSIEHRKQWVKNYLGRNRYNKNFIKRRARIIHLEGKINNYPKNLYSNHYSLFKKSKTITTLLPATKLGLRNTLKTVKTKYRGKVCLVSKKNIYLKHTDISSRKKANSLPTPIKNIIFKPHKGYAIFKKSQGNKNYLLPIKAKHLKTLNKVDKIVKIFSKDLYNKFRAFEPRKVDNNEIRKNITFFGINVLNNKPHYSISNLIQKKYMSNFVKDLLEKDILYLYNISSIYKTNAIFKNWFINSLCNTISKIYNKKVLFNIICLKYIYLNSDILIQTLSNKLLLNKRKIKVVKVLNKIKYAIEKARINEYTYDTKSYHYKYIENFNSKNLNLYPKIFRTHEYLKGPFLAKDLAKKNKAIKHLNLNKGNKNISLNKKTSFLSRYKGQGPLKRLNPILSNTINLLKFKYVFGVKLLLKGKFPNTKASARSANKSKYIGNLKHNNVINTTTSVLVTKNHQLSNVQYSKTNNPTQLGLFGVKGWINNS